MHSFYKVFCLSWGLHGGMEPRDVVKLVYQSVFGPGHMIDDEEGSLAFLTEEYERAVPRAREPLYEPLSPVIGRLNLRSLKSAFPFLTAKTVNRLFVLTAAETSGGDSSLFFELLDWARAILKRNDFSLSAESFDSYLTEYKKQGCPAVSHSETYRMRNSPSYRVISRKFIPFLPLFEAVDKALASAPFVNLAVDGFCGSGKSTLGKLISEIYGANLISADDFFLPPELRAEDRFLTPGGNIHFERFLQELAPMRENRPFSYRVFDCEIMDYTRTVEVSPKPVTVVEGSYSLRPDFRHLYDITVFLKVSETEQQRRIAKRESGDSLDMFIKRWIPLEREYFDACQIEKNADFSFDTTN